MLVKELMKRLKVPEKAVDVAVRKHGSAALHDRLQVRHTFVATEAFSAVGLLGLKADFVLGWEAGRTAIAGLLGTFIDRTGWLCVWYSG